MKLIKQKINSKKILELHLIKDKIYRNLNKKKLNEAPNQRLIEIILNFKKSLNIIYSYHKNNKRILFVGVPKEIEKLINLNTIHKTSSNINFKKTKKFSSLETQKRPEMVVIFNDTKKKSYQAKIPVIEFNYNPKRISKLNFFYSIPTNLNLTENNSLNNIFFTILNSLLNKDSKKFNKF